MVFIGFDDIVICVQQLADAPKFIVFKIADAVIDVAFACFANARPVSGCRHAGVFRIKPQFINFAIAGNG